MDSFTLSVMYETAVSGGGNSAKSQGFEAETPRGRNATYLKVLAYGYDTLTVNEKNYIETLALACPFVEGTAVLKARMLYAHFNPAMDYNNLVICNNAGVFKNGKGLFDDEDSLLQNLSGAGTKEIKHILHDNDIIVYPNPTTGILNISYQLNKDATFILYDIVGREIMKTTLSAKNNKATIELKNTPIGIYTYSIKDENNINKVGKLEVQ